jgi:hypothetical protein
MTTQENWSRQAGTTTQAAKEGEKGTAGRGTARQAGSEMHEGRQGDSARQAHRAR